MRLSLHRKRLARFLLVAVLIASSIAVAQKPISIPFTITDTSSLMIPVSTPAGDSSFILDTGAGITVLSQSLVDKLGGKLAGRFTGFRLTGERLDMQLFTIPELRVGSFVRKQIVVAGWDGLDKFHTTGMIALDFFRNEPFTLDFEHNQLILETTASIAQRHREGIAVPVKLDDQRGVTLDLFAPFLIGTQPAECEVDTGSQGYIVALPTMKRLGLDPLSLGIKQSEHTSILGNKEIRYRATLDAFSLEGTKLGAGRKTPVLFEDIIYDCNVGVDFWFNHVVTFDIPHQHLIVATHG